jgi:hypothetical protein
VSRGGKHDINRERQNEIECARGWIGINGALTHSHTHTVIHTHTICLYNHISHNKYLHTKKTLVEKVATACLSAEGSSDQVRCRPRSSGVSTASVLGSSNGSMRGLSLQKCRVMHGYCFMVMFSMQRAFVAAVSELEKCEKGHS